VAGSYVRPDHRTIRSASRSAPIIPLGRRRAVGVIRVSRTAGRKGERFISPREQRERLVEWCRANEVELVHVFEEFDQSAHRTPLLKRRGLRPAIELIERAGADVLLVAYFDRLVRNTRVQAEVIDRVEAAGGGVFALDVGEVSNATAGQWLTAQVHGMMAEYHARITGEKTARARRDAVARGVPVFPNLPPGYVRGEDGRLVVVKAERAAIIGVFELRAQGASLSACRAFLKAHGIERTYRGTQTLFSNRLYLGEIHFGNLVNLHAHEPIVDRVIFERARDRREPRGRPNKSGLLLARLGVLVCGSCGARLTSALVWNRTRKRAGPEGVRRRYPIYRCGMPGDCPAAVTISATLVEEQIIREVRHRLLQKTGSASVEQQIRDAAAKADAAQAEFKNATLLAMDFPDDQDIQAKVAIKRQAARLASERYDQLRGQIEPLAVLSATHDWDELTIEGRRALIKAVLPRVEVLPAATGAQRLRWFGPELSLQQTPLEE